LALNSSKVPARTKSEAAFSIDASSDQVRRNAIQQASYSKVNPTTAAPLAPGCAFQGCH